MTPTLLISMDGGFDGADGLRPFLRDVGGTWSGEFRAKSGRERAPQFDCLHVRTLDRVPIPFRPTAIPLPRATSGAGAANSLNWIATYLTTIWPSAESGGGFNGPWSTTRVARAGRRDSIRNIAGQSQSAERYVLSVPGSTQFGSRQPIPASRISILPADWTLTGSTSDASSRQRWGSRSVASHLRLSRRSSAKRTSEITNVWQGLSLRFREFGWRAAPATFRVRRLPDVTRR